MFSENDMNLALQSMWKIPWAQIFEPKKINHVLNKDILKKNTLNTPMPRYCETVDHKEDKLYSVIKKCILIYLSSSFIF